MLNLLSKTILILFIWAFYSSIYEVFLSFFIRIEDPDEAKDHFIVARSNCKGFAFVHIAHAQFEVAQGREAFCVY